MGGDLQLADSQSPTFIAWAQKDPKEAPLDRILIIKGWYENGELKQHIFDVATSDGRTIDNDSKVEPLDAPVNLEDGSYSGNKGAVELQAIWTDPNFDPDLNAFYYACILQIPTA